jgi:Fe-S-cluster containining protein
VRCTIHEYKPSNCSLFPIDERDLRDRDIIAPDSPCGFSFVPEAEFRSRV